MVASTLGVFCTMPNTDPRICALLVFIGSVASEHAGVHIRSIIMCMPQVFYIHVCMYACTSSGILYQIIIIMNALKTFILQHCHCDQFQFQLCLSVVGCGTLSAVGACMWGWE